MFCLLGPFHFSIIEGEDFTATEQLLTFPANSSKRQCGCIQILNDATNESSEVFTTMLSSTNAVQLANATVTILDDDSGMHILSKSTNEASPLS